VTTATFTSQFDVESEDDDPYVMLWNNDGSKLYVAGSEDTIFEYDVSTPYDVTTAALSSQFSMASELDTPEGMAWNGDGSAFFAVEYSVGEIFVYTCSTPFDVTTALYTATYPLPEFEGYTRGVTWAK